MSYTLSKTDQKAMDQLTNPTRKCPCGKYIPTYKRRNTLYCSRQCSVLRKKQLNNST